MLKPYKELPRAVHILCLGTLINRAGTMLMPFLTLYLTRELGFGMKFASLGMGAIGAGSIIGSLTGGHLADRIGRRWVMLVSLFGAAVMLVLFGCLSSPYAIIISLVLFAALGDMYRPAASAMLGDLVAPDKRAYAFGLMYFAINLGFPVGTIFGGMLVEYWFQALFYIDALSACVYAVIILVFIRETLPCRGTLVAASGTGDSGQASTSRSIQDRSAMRHILANGPFLIFCLGTLLLSMVYMQSFSTLPVHMDSLSIDAEMYGSLISINGIMIVLVQIPLTAWMKRYNRVIFVCLSAVITGIGFGAMAWVTTVPFFALTIMIWTLGEIMIFPFSHAIVTDMAPVAYRARYLGVFTMCFSSGNMVGAPLGGYILASGGGASLWVGTFLFCMLASVLFLTIRRHIAS